jgi:hypothetical protein
VQKLYINGSASNIDNNIRADGMSVRCIMDWNFNYFFN